MFSFQLIEKGTFVHNFVMKLFAPVYFITLLFIIGCAAQKSDLVNITQGVSGIVAEATGNQMPSPDEKPTGPLPIKTTIYFYDLTNKTQVIATGSQPFYTAINTKFIDSTTSNKAGEFAIALEPGKYSAFTKVDGKFYASLFDGQNNIQPVTVEANKVAQLNITVSAKAFY